MKLTPADERCAGQKRVDGRPWPICVLCERRLQHNPADTSQRVHQYTVVRSTTGMHCAGRIEAEPHEPEVA